MIFKKTARFLLPLAWAALLFAIPAAASEEETPDVHTHTVESWTEGETEHSGLCTECGETVTQPHTYYAGEQTLAPGCTAEGEMTFTCVCGSTHVQKLLPLSDHVCENWTQTEEGHSGQCVHCGEAVLREHHYDAGVVTTAPTCQAEGIVTYTCVCGHSYTGTLPKLTEHIGGSWTSDQEKHTGACVHCGEMVEEQHHYDDGVVTTEPTCQTEGVMTFTCICGHSYEQVLPQLTYHVGGQWTCDEENHTGACIFCGEVVTGQHRFDHGVITTAPTCQTEGILTFTCACGYSREEPIEKLAGHIYDQWFFDGLTHTGACGFCGEAMAGEHSYGEGKITTEPTCQADGVMTFTCTCGHSYEEVVLKGEHHVGDQWTIDEQGHNSTCILCGEAFTIQHSYDAGVTITLPTCKDDGVILFTCACGHSYEEAVPKGDYHTGSNWNYDEESHNGTCIHCGEAITGQHSYEGVITTPPTCQADGVMTFSCICGHSYEQVLPQLPDHIFSDYICSNSHHDRVCVHCGEAVSAQHIWNEGVQTQAPTCTEEGMLTFTCQICGHSKQEAIAVIEHSYGDWVSTGETHHTHSCLCGAVEEAEHTWDSGVVTVQATCSERGTKLYTCTGCGETKTTRIAMKAHKYSNSCDNTCNACSYVRRTSHTYQTKWTTNEQEHWHKCKVCGHQGSLEAHTPGEWIVDVPAGEYSDGEQHRNCSQCGRLLETVVIPATGCLHGNEELRGEKAPTCTEEGYTGDLICPRCEAVVQQGEKIPMLLHQTQLVGYVEATCAQEGYSGDWVCQVCENIVEAGIIMEMLPHDGQKQGVVEATCTENGYTGDLICKNCQHLMESGEEVPATGHSYQEGLCRVCNGKDPDYVKPTQPPTEPPTQPSTQMPTETQQPEPVVQEPLMSPVIIGCIVALAVAFVGIIVLIVIMIKKK